MKNLIFTLILVSAFCISSANDTITINSNQFFKDLNKSLVLSNLDVEFINSTWNNKKTHILLDSLYSFTQPVDSIEVGLKYEIINTENNTTYNLYFTQLPIISITTDNEIIDEPDVLAYFKMIETNQNYLESHIGIQYRGVWTQSLPKKSMEIEFWTDSTGNETQNYTLLGMVDDDDWNLQAMYNEPLRIRSKTNNDLWRMINTLHYQWEEPKAINGIRMKYTELFLNSEYSGVYCLGEKVNRKQLKLKKYKESIRGELYKGKDWGGAVTFTDLPPYNNDSLMWGGFEYKHPKKEIDWSNIHELVDFVINSTHQDFYMEYSNRFYLDNLVDYFIFLNLLRAADNYGKNIFIAKYDTNDKYFYVPYDLDGTFGIIWDGTNDNTTNDLISNGFYDRLMHDCSPDGFRDKLKGKWRELRSGIVNHDSLLSLLSSNYELLLNNGVYEREPMAWTDYVLDSEGINYISTWLSNRLSYLDDEFSRPCIPLSTNGGNVSTGLFQIYPNPTNDLVHFDSEPTKDYPVTVYNVYGQKVLQEIINSNNKTISLKHLNKGIYFFNVQFIDGIHTYKIILTE